VVIADSGDGRPILRKEPVLNRVVYTSFSVVSRYVYGVGQLGGIVYADAGMQGAQQLGF
jgi:hypothetical protein